MITGDLAAVTIRAATSADLLPLGRLAVLLVQTHHEFDHARFMEATSQTERGYASFVASQLGKPNTVVLVAVHEGRVIGYAWGSLEGVDYMILRGPAGVLHDLMVDSGSRACGVGGSLLNAAVVALQQRGATQLVLSTAARNERAQRLFVRHGFRQTMIEMTRDA